MVDVTHSGQPVYIGDLADVQRMYKDPTEYARSRGERAVLLSVEMQEGNNIVDFGKDLHAALDSFVSKDADRATAVIKAYTEIDRLNASLFAELIAHVATDPATVTRVLPLTSVCRYLERVGDHVKNLAEEVVYMVKATDVKHRPIVPAN